jgi:hypothetical protein
VEQEYLCPHNCHIFNQQNLTDIYLAGVSGSFYQPQPGVWNWPTSLLKLLHRAYYITGAPTTGCQCSTSGPPDSAGTLVPVLCSGNCQQGSARTQAALGLTKTEGSLGREAPETPAHSGQCG